MSLLQEPPKRKLPPTFTLPNTPSENLSELKTSVAKHPEFGIASEGDDRQLNFVIQETVHFPVKRGNPFVPMYKISGSFQDAGRGQTALHYKVSGRLLPPTDLSFIILPGVTGVVAVRFAGLLWKPFSIETAFILWLFFLLMILLVICVAYFKHMRDLDYFMKSFVEKMERQARRKQVAR